MASTGKCWLRLNNQTIVRYNEPLNPYFVFWLRRRFRAKVMSDGGERITLTRQEPLTEEELEEIYLETEHRQQYVSIIYGYRYIYVTVNYCQLQKVSSKAVRPL